MVIWILIIWIIVKLYYKITDLEFIMGTKANNINIYIEKLVKGFW